MTPDESLHGQPTSSLCASGDRLHRRPQQRAGSTRGSGPLHRPVAYVLAENLPGAGGRIARVRLERAAWHLSRAGATVTDVALDSGYKAPEAFTRAFRSRFGVSPSEYRRGVRARRRESTEPFEIVRRSPSRVACVRFVGPYDEANDAYDHLRHWAEPLGLLEHRNMLGIYWDDQTITEPEKTRSDAAIEVPDDLGRVVGSGIQERHLPGGAYAVVQHCGPVRGLVSRLVSPLRLEAGRAADDC
ncbi:MAG: GyrI-like domain-containing protein [Acidobacteria bacterium]|nr:GyrI-like domain-containing protein [Acidobacteriota bacterium]